MLYSQELQNKKEKAQAILAEYLKADNGMPDVNAIIIEALDGMIDAISGELKETAEGVETTQSKVEADLLNEICPY